MMLLQIPLSLICRVILLYRPPLTIALIPLIISYLVYLHRSLIAAARLKQVLKEDFQTLATQWLHRLATLVEQLLIALVKSLIS
jgi:hypothetical protein